MHGRGLPCVDYLTAAILTDSRDIGGHPHSRQARRVRRPSATGLRKVGTGRTSYVLSGKEWRDQPQGEGSFVIRQGAEAGLSVNRQASFVGSSRGTRQASFVKRSAGQRRDRPRGE
jgi:hypothetical protein